MVRLILAALAVGAAWLAWQFWKAPEPLGPKQLGDWVVSFWRAIAAIGAAFAATMLAFVAITGDVPH